MRCSPSDTRKGAHRSGKRKPKASFYQKRSRNESSRISRELAYWFASQSGPFTEALKALLDENDLAGLASFDLRYDSMVDSHFLVNARRCIALFQKNADIDLGIDKEEAAWETFAKAELKCRQTNERFRWSETGVTDAGVESLILMTQRKISQILGDCPSLEQLHFGFGPGASTTCKKMTSARRKLATLPVCSEDAVGSVNELMDLLPLYQYHHRKVVVGKGELAFVPKTAKTHRSIMIEPILNTFVQRGIGRYIKKRLYQHGCNLYDQRINRERAAIGSIFGSLATIDLSSASDMLAKNVVATLLPVEWVDLLSTWRTSLIEYKRKGLTFRLEKFSSMGNGFTFELESLIFYALSVSACKLTGVYPDVTVYGDDIIVPTDGAPAVIAALEAFGFEVNKTKSYWSGPFRESCGADYVNGFNIRPFYCKDRWTDARLVALHNHLFGSGYDDRALRQKIVSWIRPANRLYGPAGYGDGHLHSHYRGVAHRWDEGWEGFIFETYSKVPKRDSADTLPADHLLPSYTAMLREGPPKLDVRFPDTSVSVDPYSLRGGERCKKTRVYILAPA